MAAVLVVAVLLRLVFWIAVVGFDSTGGGDEPDYHRLAASVAAGQGLLGPEGEPTARRPPLYPIVLGGLYALTGPDPDAGRALQVGLGALIVFLVYALTRRILSEPAAVLAAALTAVNPSLVYVSALLLTENLYIVLLLLVLLLLVRAYECRPQPLSRFALAGVLTGLSALTRPTGTAFAGVAVVTTLLFLRAAFLRRLAAVLVFALAVAGVLAPWAARNHAVLGAWVATTTHGGITFYESNNELIPENPEFRGTVVLPRTAVPGWDSLENMGEVDLDREAWRKGIEFARENPDLLPRMALWKLERFWRIRSGLEFGTTGAGGSGGLLRLAAHPDVVSVYWMAVIPLFVLGLIVTLRRWRRLLLAYAVIVAHVLTAIVIHGSLRARTPVEPVMATFAAGATVWLVRLFMRAHGRSAGVATLEVDKEP